MPGTYYIHVNYHVELSSLHDGTLIFCQILRAKQIGYNHYLAYQNPTLKCLLGVISFETGWKVMVIIPCCK